MASNKIYIKNRKIRSFEQSDKLTNTPYNIQNRNAIIIPLHIQFHTLIFENNGNIYIYIYNNNYSIIFCICGDNLYRLNFAQCCNTICIKFRLRSCFMYLGINHIILLIRQLYTVNFFKIHIINTRIKFLYNDGRIFSINRFGTLRFIYYIQRSFLKLLPDRVFIVCGYDVIESLIIYQALVRHIRPTIFITTRVSISSKPRYLLKIF